MLNLPKNWANVHRTKIYHQISASSKRMRNFDATLLDISMKTLSNMPLLGAFSMLFKANLGIVFPGFALTAITLQPSVNTTKMPGITLITDC